MDQKFLKIRDLICSFFSQSPPQQPYSYNYEVKDDEKNNYGQSEVVDSKGFVSGSYHVLLPDGRHQYVTYKDEGFGLVAEVTYKGESIFPEYKVPAYPSRASTKTAASKTSSLFAIKPVSAEPAYKKPDAVIKETTKEASNKKITTIESIKGKPASPAPVYIAPQAITKNPSAPESVLKKTETKGPSGKLPFSEPIYRQPATTEVNYKAPVTVAPKTVSAYTSTPAYKTLTTTTPVYKTQQQVYTTTTHKAPVYTTTAYKGPILIANKEPVYTVPVNKGPIKKAPAISPPSYNKVTPYVGPVYKGPPYHKMPVYKGPTYRVVVNPVTALPKYQQVSAPVPLQPASYSVPIYKQAAKH